MSSVLSSPRAFLALLVPIFVAYLYGTSLQRTITVLGALRKPANTLVTNPDDFVTIEDTVYCEDLHYYAPTHSLFTACEDSVDIRFGWFPGLATFHDPALGVTGRGSIHVIDPVTMKSRRLSFENFDSTFVTHGIDVIADPESADGSAVYIFAVNHVPNPEYVEATRRSEGEKGAGATFEGEKASSRIEVFHHLLGSSSVRHVRTVRHPLIATPNDIFADSPTSFYVTNDHFYREGHMRTLEDAYFGATWSTIVHARFSPDDGDGDGDSGVRATVAKTGLHNNNGLGHGKNPDDILIDSTTSGTLHLGKIPSGKEQQQHPAIRIVDSVQVDAVADNPTYFADPFAADGRDASGYVLAGLSRAVDLAGTCRDPKGTEPVMVWYVKPGTSEGGDGWEKRLLFEDDGSRIRSASAAVLVAIDPEAEGGRRRAWLFVTGFLSSSVIAVKVDL